MLLVQLPIMLIASMIGVTLFSVQHRFETAVWRRRTEVALADRRARKLGFR
jgi:acyl-lipid omega-6 desaturase (Delta-12 desaturase)